jgi:hypothetical protein
MRRARFLARSSSAVAGPFAASPSRRAGGGNFARRGTSTLCANFGGLTPVNNAPNLRAVRNLFGSVALFVVVLTAYWFLLP